MPSELSLILVSYFMLFEIDLFFSKIFLSLSEKNTTLVVKSVYYNLEKQQKNGNLKVKVG